MAPLVVAFEEAPSRVPSRAGAVGTGRRGPADQGRGAPMWWWALMASSNGRLRMRNPVPGAHGGGLYVSELQRARLLDATFAVVAEVGYRGMAVRAVAERAGVSSKTFYDLFSDREDCFLAAFDYGVEELAARAGRRMRGSGIGRRVSVAALRCCWRFSRVSRRCGGWCSSRRSAPAQGSLRVARRYGSSWRV